MKEQQSARRLLMMVFATLLATGLRAAGATESDDCHQTKDLDRAIAACSEAIRVSPQWSRAFAQRGFAYFLKFDYERAFADYEEAIRRNPKDIAAYHYRGIVFQIRGDDDRAIADFTKALELGSKDPRVLLDRGSTYFLKGAVAQSLADYSAVIQRDPNYWIAYLLRGVAYTYSGALEKAQADFKQGSELEPKVPYFPIWLHIAERRANMASSLASSIDNLNMTKWPAPVVRMFLGEETPDEVLTIGASKARTQLYGACEANFFVAEHLNLQNKRDEAVRLYRAAQQDCRRNFVESVAASAALRSLGANP